MGLQFADLIKDFLFEFSNNLLKGLFCSTEKGIFCNVGLFCSFLLHLASLFSSMPIVFLVTIKTKKKN
jgi:hypothetical protein